MKAEGAKTWSTPVAAEAAADLPCPVCRGEAFVPALGCRGFAYVRCRACGLLQINPQPTPDAVADRYGRLHGADYLAYELANEAAFLGLQLTTLADLDFPALEAAARREAARRGAARPCAVDVGCATGALLERLGGRGWATAGVELGGPQAAWAREKRGLDVRTGDLAGASFPAGWADLVHASQLIEHLNDPRAFLAEVRRVLAPTGVLILATPNAAGWQAGLFGASWRSAIFDHLYLFAPSQIKRLLADTGFAVARMVTWGGLAKGTAPAPIKKIADRLAKRLGGGDVMALLCRPR